MNVVRLSRIVACTLLFLVLCAVTESFAIPDTLDVAPSPSGNLFNVISGDTLAGGVRAHPDRVYRLQRGAVYAVGGVIRVHGSLHIAATSGSLRPPVVYLSLHSDHLFEFSGDGADVTISDVYIRSVRLTGQQAHLLNNGILIVADGVSLALHGVVVDSFSGIAVWVKGQWTNLDVRDCHFRNLQHPSSWFSGQAFFAQEGIHWGSVTFINNTFFACNAYILSILGYNRELIFDHNTLVFGVVNPLLVHSASHMSIKNNIFYAMHAMGGNPDHVINSWFLNYPDTSASSLMMLRAYDTLSTWYHLWGDAPLRGPDRYEDPAHGVTGDMLDPGLRTVDIRNNAYYWPQRYLDFVAEYNATVNVQDSIEVPVYGQDIRNREALTRRLYLPQWMNAYTTWVVDSLLPALSPGIVVADNAQADPGFTTDVTGHIDSLISYVHAICVNGLEDLTWMFHPSEAGHTTWPLREDLAYSNGWMQCAGTDGYPLGDLNWFPERKSAWLVQFPLPVQLLDLVCVPVDAHSARISWRTLSETDNFGYWVQRRRAGDPAFADLAGAFIPGNGTSVRAHTYSFTDSTIEEGCECAYRLKQMDLDGALHYSDAVTVRMALSGVESPVPPRYALLQNFPNPFNPVTVIRYELPEAGVVRLAVYDVLGREVTVLVNAPRGAGIHDVRFDGSSLPSGMYVYRLQAGQFSETRKLILAK